MDIMNAELIAKKVKEGGSLLEQFPELSKEWHPTKNKIRCVEGNINLNNVRLKPSQIYHGSHQIAIWICSKKKYHVYDMPVYRRTQMNQGCPFCAGQRTHVKDSLFTSHPNVAKEWHPTKNDLTPKDKTRGSNYHAWWKCIKYSKADNNWQAYINDRTRRKDRCPYCTGRELTKCKLNSIKYTHPELAKEWHPDNLYGPENYTSIRKKESFFWICKINSHHKYEMPIYLRIKGHSCNICASKVVNKYNCLATTHPELAKEWHPTKNDLTPNDVLAGSDKRITWLCRKCGYSWPAMVNNRANKESKCSNCRLTPQSKQELTITFELIKFFKEINPKGFKTRVDSKLWSIDIYISELNLGIEFDGSYWHKDKRALDKLKTKQLKKEGFDIIRVREAPLKKINRTDVISKQPFNGKEVANKVLKQIMKMNDLDAKKIAKIESYISKKELQNEKGLDKYIEMILTEKAEKNK